MNTNRTDNRRKGFHLTYEDRIYIQSALESNMSFKEIGIALGKHPTTISKEVRKHMIVEPPRNFNNEYATNRCKYRYSCQLMNVCGSLTCVRKKCKTCGKCNAYCKRFVLDLCTRKDKPPYVCNSCVKSHKWCQFEKRMYKAVVAQREYVSSLHESREGINMTKVQLAQLDELISPLILKKGNQSAIYMPNTKMKSHAAYVPFIPMLKNNTLQLEISICAVKFATKCVTIEYLQKLLV